MKLVVAACCLVASLNAFAVRVDYCFTFIRITLDNGRQVKITAEQINTSEIRGVSHVGSFFPVNKNNGQIYQFKANTEEGEITFTINDSTGMISLTPQYSSDFFYRSTREDRLFLKMPKVGHFRVAKAQIRK